MTASFMGEEFRLWFVMTQVTLAHRKLDALMVFSQLLPLVQEEEIILSLLLVRFFLFF